MNKQLAYVITISRQLGSGGAYVGRKIATELGISYVDRDILERAAESLQVRAEEVEARDECAPTFMETVSRHFPLVSQRRITYQFCKHRASRSCRGRNQRLFVESVSAAQCRHRRARRIPFIGIPPPTPKYLPTCRV